MSGTTANTELFRGIRLDREQGAALHCQLRRGIEALIEDGRLRPGDRIPPVADIARLSGVSLTTAMRATRELSARRLVSTRRRSGTHVMPKATRSTEIIIAVDHLRSAESVGDFYLQIVEGLREGYAEPGRRFLTTFVQRGELAPDEVLDAARARAVDGIIFYQFGIDGAGAAAIKRLALQLPVVALVKCVSPSQVSNVTVDPAPAVREILRRRLDEGRRDFAYLGHLAHLQGRDGADESAAKAIYRCFLATLKQAGITPVVRLSPQDSLPNGDAIAEAEDYLAREAGQLPQGAVLCAQFGTLARRLTDVPRDFDVIGYTERRATLERCRGRATMMYAGLEMLSREAVRLLRASAAGDPVQSVTVVPVVHERTPAPSSVGHRVGSG